jgi:TetR/AcrR family transcriptional regulator, fatty acid metabolism regulator protein
MVNTSRQSEIIDAAGKILTSSGVSGLTIKNLAREMGFSESAIYRHFSSKEEIIIAMLDYLSGTMNERLQSANHSEDDPETKFKLVFRNLVDFFIKNQQFVVAVFSDGLMEESQRINEALLKLMNVVMKHLLPVIIEGQQKKVFTSAITADEMVHIATGTFKLQMFKWKISGFNFDIGRACDRTVQSVITLIKTNKS